ncbi:MAG: endopeptidase IV [Legionellaceae bacterium]|nr:endopeptidase IV [Legionellaceae bacterium]
MKIRISCGVVVLGLVASITVGQAAKVNENAKPPLGCRDLGYRFELKTLHLLPDDAGERNSMYFLYNKSERALNLYQMRQEESSRSAFLNHAIRSGEWAVFATSEKDIRFICATPEHKSRYGKVVDCSQYLTVCEYNNVKFGLNNRGNYWLVNSSSRNTAVREVVRYGIIPAQ